MARRPSPWYWEERAQWMVTLNGVRHNLGDHPAGAPKPQKNKAGKWNSPKAIHDKFISLYSVPAKAAGNGSTIDVVLQAFHDWNKENRAKRTADRYFEFNDSFERRWHGLMIKDLDASHVQLWLNEQKQWNSTTKRNAITALQRAFNWACKNMGIDRNPIRGMEKPEAKRRTTIVSPAEFDELLKHVNEFFADLIIVSYDSGARPQEVKQLEARHIQLDKSRAVLPTEEGKGGIPRAIYFPTERSIAIVKRLMASNPTGPLFRNRKGKAWTAFAVKCQFERSEKKMGKRFRHYDLRRTFITGKIVAGVDSHVVAALAGHKSTAMIDKHYSAIGDNPEFMLKMAQTTSSNASVHAAKRKKKAK